MTITITMLPIAVQATCTSGAPPAYQDISQVDITQTGCTGTLTPGPPPTFRCSRFWASFYPDKATYSQFNLPDRVGTYELPASLNDIRKVLQEASFFALLPPEQNVPTDQSLFTISVQHCSVVTSITIYNWPGDDLDQINNLFERSDVDRRLS
ncbi:MAG: hypothetical protein ACLQHL_11555 [Candidatus Cybelea sp.]